MRRGRGSGCVVRTHDRFRARLRAGGREAFGPLRATWNEAEQDRLDMLAEPAVWDVQDITFAQACEQWLQLSYAKYAGITRRNNEHFLKVFCCAEFGNRSVADITSVDCVKFAAGLSVRGYSSSYVRKILLALRWVFSYCVSHGMRKDNPASEVSLPKVLRSERAVLDSQSLMRLCDVAHKSDFPLLILLAARCGLRVSECVGLQQSDMNEQTGFLAVKRAAREVYGKWELKAPKNNRTRSVWCPADVVSAFTDRRQKIKSAWMYSTDGSRFVYRNRINNAVKKACREAGVPEVTMHSLRHSHATHLLASGVHIKIAQERLGHSTIAITADLYSHASAQMQKDALSQVL